MEFRLRNIPNEAYITFRDAARGQQMTVNELLIKLIEKTAKEWKRGEEARILKAADEIRQRKLL